MLIVWFLAPVAVFMGIGFLVAFIWAARGGQMDDLVTPPLRMLLNEEDLEKKEEKNHVVR